MSRDGAAAAPSGTCGVTGGLIAGVGGFALLLAVESGVFEIENMKLETMLAGVGAAAAFAGVIGVAKGGYERALRKD